MASAKKYKIGNLQFDVDKRQICGSSKADAIDSKGGFDWMAGGRGGDSYRYSAGDGSMTINEGRYGGDQDRLELRGLKSDDVDILRKGNDMVLRVKATGETITVKNQFQKAGGGYGVESLGFADGKTVSTAEFAADGLRDVNLKYNSKAQTVTGTAANNLFDAWDGFATLLGARGSDTYVFSRSSDSVRIVEDVNDRNAVDVLRLDGIGMDDVKLSVQGRHLVITILSTGETITINNQFLRAGSGIEFIQFDNGKSVDAAGIATALANGGLLVTPANEIVGTDQADTIDGTDGVDHITGLDGDDTIVAGAGEDIIEAGGGLDTIWGGEGADIFVFGAGSGYDYIIDFQPGIDMIQLGTSVVADGKSPLDYAYQDGPSTIFEFPDGNVLVLWHVDLADLTADMFDVVPDMAATPLDLVGTDADDRLVGGDAEDTLFGGAGFDVLTGGDGADRFVFGTNSDRDFVTDFNADHDEIVLLDGLLEDGKTALDYAYMDGQNTIFEFAGGQTLVLWHVDLASLTAVNFADPLLA
ncbi:MAG: calcium-binding protein [Rhizobiaceae bacterium]